MYVCRYTYKLFPKSWYKTFPTPQTATLPRSSSLPLRTAILSSIIIVLSVFPLHRYGQCVPLFCLYFVSTMPACFFYGSIHLCYLHTLSRSTLFFTAVLYSTVYIVHNLLIHSNVDGHLGCFQYGASANKATMDMLVPITWWTQVPVSVVHIPEVHRLSGCLTLTDSASFQKQPYRFPLPPEM